MDCFEEAYKVEEKKVLSLRLTDMLRMKQGGLYWMFKVNGEMKT